MRFAVGGAFAIQRVRQIMWIVRLALNRPYTFVVVALLILMLAPVVTNHRSKQYDITNSAKIAAQPHRSAGRRGRARPSLANLLRYPDARGGWDKVAADYRAVGDPGGGYHPSTERRSYSGSGLAGEHAGIRRFADLCAHQRIPEALVFRYWRPRKTRRPVGRNRDSGDRRATAPGARRSRHGESQSRPGADHRGPLAVSIDQRLCLETGDRPGGQQFACSEGRRGSQQRQCQASGGSPVV